MVMETETTQGNFEPDFNDVYVTGIEVQLEEVEELVIETQAAYRKNMESNEAWGEWANALKVWAALKTLQAYNAGKPAGNRANLSHFRRSQLFDKLNG